MSATRWRGVGMRLLVASLRNPDRACGRATRLRAGGPEAVGCGWGGGWTRRAARGALGSGRDAPASRRAAGVPEVFRSRARKASVRCPAARAGRAGRPERRRSSPSLARGKRQGASHATSCRWRADWAPSRSAGPLASGPAFSLLDAGSGSQARADARRATYRAPPLGKCPPAAVRPRRRVQRPRRPPPRSFHSTPRLSKGALPCRGTCGPDC